MENQEISPRSRYEAERTLVTSLAKTDHQKAPFWASRLREDLELLLDSYRFENSLPVHWAAIGFLANQAPPEYQVLRSELTLLTRQQAVLHTRALDVIGHHHRNRFWKQMSGLLDAFSQTRKQLVNDAEYAIVAFEYTVNPRLNILHDFAVAALQDIPWEYETVPDEAYDTWRLLHGIKNWRGAFNTTTIFALRDADVFVHKIFKQYGALKNPSTTYR